MLASLKGLLRVTETPARLCLVGDKSPAAGPDAAVALVETGGGGGMEMQVSRPEESIMPIAARNMEVPEVRQRSTSPPLAVGDSTSTPLHLL